MLEALVVVQATKKTYLKSIEKSWPSSGNKLCMVIPEYHHTQLGNLQIQNIQPEVTTESDNIDVLEDIVISEFPEPVASSVEVQAQQVPEPHQTGLESPVSQPQPARSRPRPRHNRDSTTISRTRIDPEWVKVLETNRVQAENKMADATLIIAEAAKKIAEASLMNAETCRMQLEVMKTMSKSNSALAAMDTNE